MFKTDYEEYLDIPNYLERECGADNYNLGQLERIGLSNNSLLNTMGRLLEELYNKGVISIKELNVIVENQDTGLKEI